MDNRESMPQRPLLPTKSSRRALSAMGVSGHALLRLYLMRQRWVQIEPGAAFPRQTRRMMTITHSCVLRPRSLFDASLGKNNIFHKERYKVNLDLTAINITDKYALYNFLSTFSGTHYVTPRALTAKITLNF